MEDKFLGLPANVWAGVLLSSIIVPVLWWFVRRFMDWLQSRFPTRLLLKGMCNKQEYCQITLADFTVELHPPGDRSNSQDWPLVRMLPTRLGGESCGRGINIDKVWGDCDGQAVSDILNLLGQAGKSTDIGIVRFSEDSGNRDSHLIVVGGQDYAAQDFYAQMQGVYYKMNALEIYDAHANQIIVREPGYGYGLILKTTNPFSVHNQEAVAILVGGFGTLGTMAAAYYLRTHAKELAARFGRQNFGVVVRAPVSTGYQGVQRVVPLDRPTLTLWSRVAASLRGIAFRTRWK